MNLGFKLNLEVEGLQIYSSLAKSASDAYGARLWRFRGCKLSMLARFGFRQTQVP